MNMSIEQRLKLIKEEIISAQRRSLKASKQVTLIAVSKKQPLQSVETAVQLGIKDLGENHVQDLMGRKQKLTKDSLYWHMIGTVQRNKVKYLVGHVDFIHTVDRIALAEMISKRASNLNVIQKVFVQVNIASENTKLGIDKTYGGSFLEEISQMPGLQIVGLSTMPPATKDSQTSRPYFAELKSCLDEWRDKIKNNASYFQFLSMGTSQDYGIAIEEGATHVRIGELIFGPRVKSVQ